MKVASIIIVAALGLSACGATPGEGTAATTSATGTTQTVCNLDGIHNGWVVIEHTNWPLCTRDGLSVDSWNAYSIAPAYSGVTVCGDSPLPNGYVKAEMVKAVLCIVPMFAANNYTNAFVIKAL